MNSTIGEPFQLYLTSTLSTQYHTAVYTSHNRDSLGYATITTQGDGIHIWDLQNLHALASYCVGNHVVFATPAVSLYVTENENKFVFSYAAVASAPDMDKQHRGRLIWVVRQSLSGSSVATSEKTLVVVAEPPARICCTSHDIAPLLIVSKNGNLSLASARVEIKSQLDWPGERKHLETFIFSKKSCSFIQDDTGSCTSVAIICCQSGMSLQVRMVLLGDEIVPAGICEIPVASSISEGNTDILSVTCSASGVLSLIDTYGIWVTYQLVSLNASLNSTRVSENLQLGRLAFPRHTQMSRACFSVVSLGTSLVLFAALLEKTREIWLQIWDLSYGVLLAAQSMPAPSSPPLAGLSLTVANEGQVLLTVSALQVRETKAKSSSVSIIPVESQLKSSLAGALSKLAQTAEWLVPKTSDNRASPKIISDVQTSLEKRNVQKAEQAFLQWIGSQESKQAALGHEFVKKILKTVLAVGTRSSYPYAPRITRYLLENAVVSTIMLDGCLITALRQRGDWENLMFALTKVEDISEDELMASAKFLIDRQRRSEDAMDVDTSEGYVPPLWSYLSACVSYPFSPAPMRLSIRKHLPDAQDLIVVLEILGNWIQGGTEHEVEVLLKSVSTNTKTPPSRVDCPPYPKVINFLQALLDASFVALLQHQPSHDILHRILSYVEPEVALIDSLEPLRGMLEPFTKVHVLKEKTRGQKESPEEWRKRRKQLEQRVDLTVGLYRLEELVL